MIRPCLCGCGRRLVTYRRGHRFASATCAQRWRRRQRPPVLITPAMRRQWAVEAARSRVIGTRLRLIRALARLDRDAAIYRAWQLGKRQAYRERTRERALAA
jgi:hypothetical protein